MKNIVLAFSLVTLHVFTACTKGGEPNGVTGDMYTVTGMLDGSKLNTPVTNDTTKATINGRYDEETNILTFTFSYKKDTTVFKKDTLAGIYFFKEKPSAAPAGFTRSFGYNVNIDASTRPNPTNIAGSINYGLSGVTQLSAQEKQSFLAGNWYAVLVSKKFPSGVAGGPLMVAK